MREICQSGSEGGARFNPSSLPLYGRASEESVSHPAYGAFSRKKVSALVEGSVTTH
jgi:hypothetical protein